MPDPIKPHIEPDGSLHAPSNSTIASVGLGIPLATIVSWLCDEFLNVTMPGEVQAALGALVSALVGYVFLGGRRADTE